MNHDFDWMRDRMREMFPHTFPFSANGIEMEKMLIDEVLRVSNRNIDDATTLYIQMLGPGNFFFFFFFSLFISLKKIICLAPPENGAARIPIAPVPPPPPARRIQPAYAAVPQYVPPRNVDKSRVPVYWDFVWENRFRDQFEVGKKKAAAVLFYNDEFMFMTQNDAIPEMEKRMASRFSRRRAPKPFKASNKKIEYVKFPPYDPKTGF
jgi:hypothetical protein